MKKHVKILKSILNGNNKDVVGALNTVFGPEKWKFMVVGQGIERWDDGHSAWVLVRLSFLTDSNEWFDKGDFFGYAEEVMAGPALKAATMDAIAAGVTMMMADTNGMSEAPPMSLPSANPQTNHEQSNPPAVDIAQVLKLMRTSRTQQELQRAAELAAMLKDEAEKKIARATYLEVKAKLSA